MKRVKKGSCPNCNKEMIRSRPVHIKKLKTTKCNHCGFVIENPYKILSPVNKNA